MKQSKENNILLSPKLLTDLGFKLLEEVVFENYTLPYYAKDAVILFFNTPITKWNKSDFLIGYAEMKGGKYFAVTFRWINTLIQLEEIYKAVRGKELEKHIKKTGKIYA